jgi:hypothetical protein
VVLVKQGVYLWPTSLADHVQQPIGGSNPNFQSHEEVIYRWETSLGRPKDPLREPLSVVTRKLCEAEAGGRRLSGRQSPSSAVEGNNVTTFKTLRALFSKKGDWDTHTRNMVHSV